MKLAIYLIALLALTGCTNSPEKPRAKSENSLNDNELAGALTALFGEAVTPDLSEIEKYPLGSAENPVRASGPAGQREYLSKLICDNNETVSAFDRAGSSGVGPYGSILDLYIAICDTNKGAIEHYIYMDMYHNDYQENRPAHGFKAVK